jgi:hypothetical protein
VLSTLSLPLVTGDDSISAVNLDASVVDGFGDDETSVTAT